MQQNRAAQYPSLSLTVVDLSPFNVQSVLRMRETTHRGHVENVNDACKDDQCCYYCVRATQLSLKESIS